MNCQKKIFNECSENYRKTSWEFIVITLKLKDSMLSYNINTTDYTIFVFNGIHISDSHLLGKAYK